MLKETVQNAITSVREANIFGIFITRAKLITLEYSGFKAHSWICQKSAVERFTKIMQIVFCAIFKYGKFSPE